MTSLPGGRDEQISEEMIEAAARALRPWIWIQRTGGVIQEIKNARSQSLADARDALTAALRLLPDEAAIRADERARVADRLALADGSEALRRMRLRLSYAAEQGSDWADDVRASDLAWIIGEIDMLREVVGEGQEVAAALIAAARGSATEESGQAGQS